jgi:hypothetical protein
MIVALSGTASPAAWQKGKVDTGPGSLTAARKYLEGRWSLMSFEVFPPGESPIRVSGSGMLTYDAFGNLEMEIRVDDQTATGLRAVGIPITDGKLSTSGRTVVNLQARTLTYVIKGQPPVGAPSGPLALNRPRHWEVEGNVLTLTTKGDGDQPLSIARWQKMQ